MARLAFPSAAVGSSARVPDLRGPGRGPSSPSGGASYGEKVVVVSASTLMEDRSVCRQEDHCLSAPG